MRYLFISLVTILIPVSACTVDDLPPYRDRAGVEFTESSRNSPDLRALEDMKPSLDFSGKDACSSLQPTRCEGICTRCPEGEQVVTSMCTGPGVCEVTQCKDGWEVCETGCCARESNMWGVIDGWSSSLNEGTLQILSSGEMSMLIGTGDTFRTATLTKEGWELASVSMPLKEASELQTSFSQRAVALDGRGNPHMVYSTRQSIWALVWEGKAWRKEQIPNASNTDTRPTDLHLHVDAQNVPHLLYSDSFGGQVTYVTKREGAWVEVPLPDTLSRAYEYTMSTDLDGVLHVVYKSDSSCFHGKLIQGQWQTRDNVIAANSPNRRAPLSTLKFDAQNNPHMVIGNNGTLSHLTSQGETWRSTELLTSINMPRGQTPRFQIDSKGKLHIMVKQSRENDLALRYMVWEGATKQEDMEVITLNPNSQAAEFILDQEDKPHVMLPRLSQSDVVHLQLAQKQWSTELVVPVSAGGFVPSAVLDKRARMQVAYAGANRDKFSLDFAWWTGNTWNTTTLNTQMGTLPTLRLDSKGFAHISAQNRRSIYYVTRQGGVGSEWTQPKEVVLNDLAASHANQATALALDNTDTPSIIYTINNRGIGHAVLKNGIWITQQVDEEGVIGYTDQAAFDTKNNLHLIYSDPKEGAVKYAVWDQNSWNISTLESLGGQNIAQGIAMKVDTEDNVHVSYRLSGDGEVLYWRRDAQGWKRTVVDQAPWKLGGTSLALDSANRPHITYEANQVNEEGMTLVRVIDLRYAKLNANGTWERDVVGTKSNRQGKVSLMFNPADDTPWVGFHVGTGNVVRAGVRRDGTWLY